eukprot:COSAG01_NODE_494_length_16322_cov_35.380879_5_plen_47_part_00
MAIPKIYHSKFEFNLANMSEKQRHLIRHRKQLECLVRRPNLPRDSS